MEAANSMSPANTNKSLNVLNHLSVTESIVPSITQTRFFARNIITGRKTNGGDGYLLRLDTQNGGGGIWVRLVHRVSGDILVRQDQLNHRARVTWDTSVR